MCSPTYRVPRGNVGNKFPRYRTNRNINVKPSNYTFSNFLTFRAKILGRDKTIFFKVAAVTAIFDIRFVPLEQNGVP